MAKYIKKPVAIEAVEWTGSNMEEMKDFMGEDWIPCDLAARKIYIDTLKGEMCGNEGDMIIKGISGEFYPCKPDIFRKTYFSEKEYAELGNG